MAGGKPVLAFARGGALETVLAGKTGDFFYEQTADSLHEALVRFDASKYDPEDCKRQAANFSLAKFEQRIREVMYNNFIMGS
jgi:glycosyltransferase involved in cell wall biosynthesis